ncbi:MAG: carboxymuconolactone decarboxylase family protein [Burkholderiales bacterium]
MTQRLDHQALAPEAMRVLAAVYQHVGKSGLPGTLLNLVFLRASQINGCAFCIASHTQDLLREGVSPMKLQMLQAWRESGALFSPAECAALEWTEVVTLIGDTHAPDDAYAAVSTHFEGRQLVELTLAIALINAYNRLAIAFRRTPPLQSQ